MAVYKDGNTGKWRAVFRFTDWKGERKQTQKRGFATKREVLNWERETMLKQEVKLDMTFGSFFEIYETDKRKRVKENTWESKSHVIRTKILPYFESRKMEEIEPKELRTNMIVFRYQLRYISRGKYKLGEYLDSAKPILAEYLALVQKIKTAAKERKTMLTEKKEISFWNASKHKELSAKIAKLTEDIEEMKSEKAVLLNQLDCADDSGIATIKKDITAAEASLSKLEQQEEKYSSELETALSEYADLKEQSTDFEPAELYAQRMALRSEKSASVSNRIHSAYGEKYDPLLMFDSQRDIAELLQEDAENRVYQQEMEQRKRQEQTEKPRHSNPER